MTRFWRWFWTALIGIPVLVFVVWAIQDNARLFTVTLLNGLTLSSLYFIVAAGFTLVFGLMRNVNLAHGSLYLLGGYIGFFVAQKTGWFVLALAAGFLGAAAVGLAMQVGIFRFMPGQDLRQTMVTIALSTVLSAINSLTLSPALAAVLLAGPVGAQLKVVTSTTDLASVAEAVGGTQR